MSIFRRRSSTAGSQASSTTASPPISPGGSQSLTENLAEQKAKYLGSVSVEAGFPRNEEDPLVLDAITRCLQLRMKPRKVLIRIKALEVSVIDRESNEAIQTTPITEVTYSGVDPTKDRRFVYITQSGTHLKTCHVFDTKTDANGLPQAVGQAFAITGAEMKKIREGKAGRSSSISASGSGSGGGGGASAEGGSDGGTAAENGGVSSITELVKAAMDLRRKAKSAPAIIGKVFDGFYLGSIAVSKKYGEGIVQEAWKQLLAKDSSSGESIASGGSGGLGGKKGKVDKDSLRSEDACSITITDENLGVFNRFTQETIFSEFIKTISFIYVVKCTTTADVVAYIVIDERLV